MKYNRSGITVFMGMWLVATGGLASASAANESIQIPSENRPIASECGQFSELLLKGIGTSPGPRGRK